ncbi:MAG: cupin domain-containing protein [Burkholderiales bacterium]
MSRPIINIHDVEMQPFPPAFAPTGAAAERYAPRMAQVGRKLGAKKLGYNVTAVPPGKRAFPAHNHRVNEEMFFILEGEGELHVEDAVHAVRPGDVVACPPGGPETAHQIVNTGSVELKYLAVSTKISPEIVDYPKTGKFGVLHEYEDADGKPQMFRFVGRADRQADYWEGE